MGLETPHYHPAENEDDPVTRRECYLHRKAMDDRVRNVETDLKEIKTEIRLIKESMDKFFEKQETKWDRLWVCLIILAILIAAGRLFDITTLLEILT